MRLLLVHNHYQLPGGEDVVAKREAEMLRWAGHEIIEYTRSNSEINKFSIPKRAGLFFRYTWSLDSFRDLNRLLEKAKPDIAHFHNNFALISPSGYYACQSFDVPVVQTLHNPRLLCPAAVFYRDGRLCLDCLGKRFAWPGVAHACYRNSRMQTLSVATSNAIHRAIGTWNGAVTAYIASTEFYRQKFIKGGIPAHKIKVKPHFVDRDPIAVERPVGGAGGYALFVGRLQKEKGIDVILRAWEKLAHIPLKIRGEGPMMTQVRTAISEGRLQQGEIIGRLNEEDLARLIKGAMILVWPSGGYYETFGLVAIEAFACGIAVLATGQGVPAELVDDGETGLLFSPGDAEDLAAKVRWASEHPDEMRRMGARARRVYEEKYTPEVNYRQLMAIYEEAIEERRSGRQR